MPNQEIFSVENKRAAQFMKENKQLELVKHDIENINYPFLIVLIFGSYVKKTQAKRIFFIIRLRSLTKRPDK